MKIKRAEPWKKPYIIVRYNPHLQSWGPANIFEGFNCLSLPDKNVMAKIAADVREVCRAQGVHCPTPCVKIIDLRTANIVEKQ